MLFTAALFPLCNAVVVSTVAELPASMTITADTTRVTGSTSSRSATDVMRNASFPEAFCSYRVNGRVAEKRMAVSLADEAEMSAGTISAAE